MYSPDAYIAAGCSSIIFISVSLKNIAEIKTVTIDPNNKTHSNGIHLKDHLKSFMFLVALSSRV